MTQCLYYIHVRVGVDVHIVVVMSTYSQLHFSFCVPDTKAAFGGSPPLWVYTLMSKPLLRLKGLQGYRDMYRLSSTAALEFSQFRISEAEGETTTFICLDTVSMQLFLSLSLSLSLSYVQL